jgi:hypothetical protein
MDKIADTLIFAVTFINCHGDENNEDLRDENIGALESIAYMLSEATPAELDTLATAAERALATELASRHPRPAWVHDYRHWMEELLPDGWIGNTRVAN